MSEVILTEQEIRVIDFLMSKNNGSIYWEELAQFAKSPQTVKLKTIKKTISELKRKYVETGLPVPFNVKFATMPTETPAPVPQVQNLVQIKRTPAGNTMVVDGNNTPSMHPAQVDFTLDMYTKRVKTRFGSHQLNDSEWEVFKYVHAHAGKLIPISELRDKVVYPQWGSKLPARWFDAIMRIINNMRRAIPGLDLRLLTVKGAETSYLFQ